LRAKLVAALFARIFALQRCRVLSSVFAPSRRRRTALWRAFQRPLDRELKLAAIIHQAEAAADAAARDSAGSASPPATIPIARHESHK
jgi:hypothetical protein